MLAYPQDPKECYWANQKIRKSFIFKWYAVKKAPVC